MTTQTDTPLSEQTIVATRPLAEQAGLISHLQSLGATPLALPLLAIEPTTPAHPNYATTRAAILDLDLYSHVIFVSPSAARNGYAWIDDYWPQLPIGINWLAMGQKTQKTLSDLGLDSHISPNGYDSEALLTLPTLQNVSGQRILIMRGEGGRPYLADELVKRGADVDHAVLYTREKPQYDTNRLNQTLYEAKPHGILVTSGESLNNLITLSQALSTQAQQALLNCKLVVPSQRTYTLAIDLGFTKVNVASGPDNAAMCAALMN